VGCRIHLLLPAERLTDYTANHRRFLLTSASSFEQYRQMIYSGQNFELFQKFHIGIVVHGPDSRVLFSNNRASELLGLSAEQMIGKEAIDPTWRFVDEGERELSADQYPISKILATHEPLRDLALGIKWSDQAQPVWVLVNGFPEFDTSGALQHVVVHFYDITTLKQAQRDRDHIFNFSIDPIALCGFDGYFKDVNPAWTKLLGWTAEELTSRPWLEFIHPDDHEGTKQVKAELDHDQPLLKFENRYRHKDGSYRWFSWRAYPLPVEQIIVAIARDVTDSKQMELEVLSSLQEKTALLKEIHHRVKNNLQVISSLLRQEGRRSTVDQTKAVLGDMQARIRAMALLHESLNRSGTFASVDLGHYLRQLSTHALQTQATDSGAVKLDLNLGSVQVSMDQAIPCGLLINELISNCLKHAFPAGAAGQVRIDLQPLGGPSQWCLRVSDTGVGLPEDFEEKSKNSLGLQLVGDLARQIRGELMVTPNQEKGVSFTVNFHALKPAPLDMPA
jgi:PAS domain S-box-containing protein